MTNIKIHVDKYYRGDGTPVKSHGKMIDKNLLLNSSEFKPAPKEDTDFTAKGDGYAKKEISDDEFYSQFENIKRDNAIDNMKTRLAEEKKIFEKNNPNKKLKFKSEYQDPEDRRQAMKDGIKWEDMLDKKKLNTDMKHWIKDDAKRKEYDWDYVKKVLIDNGYDSDDEINEARDIFNR